MNFCTFMLFDNFEENDSIKIKKQSRVVEKVIHFCGKYFSKYVRRAFIYFGIRCSPNRSNGEIVVFAEIAIVPNWNFRCQYLLNRNNCIFDRILLNIMILLNLKLEVEVTSIDRSHQIVSNKITKFRKTHNFTFNLAERKAVAN